MDDTSIGVRIRRFRGKALTQRQLADQAGVSVDLVRKLEQGGRQTASIASLQKLARALDVDISDLVYLVDYMFNQGPQPPPCP